MEHNDNQSKNKFTKSGAWLGMAAYIVLIITMAVIFMAAR